MKKFIYKHSGAHITITLLDETKESAFNMITLIVKNPKAWELIEEIDTVLIPDPTENKEK